MRELMNLCHSTISLTSSRNRKLAESFGIWGYTSPIMPSLVRYGSIEADCISRRRVTEPVFSATKSLNCLRRVVFPAFLTPVMTLTEPKLSMFSSSLFMYL